MSFSNQFRGIGILWNILYLERLTIDNLLVLCFFSIKIQFPGPNSDINLTTTSLYNKFLSFEYLYSRIAAEIKFSYGTK